VTTGALSSKQADPPEEARWDFFVSYTQTDHVWAEWIAWQLHDAGYQVLIQAWYTVAGSNWVVQLQEGILRSERTVAVLSEDYLNSAHVQSEWEAAHAADPHGFARKLIPVRVAACSRLGLFSRIVTVDLVGLTSEAARAELLNRISVTVAGHDRPSMEPVFPAGRSEPVRTAESTDPAARVDRLRLGDRAMVASFPPARPSLAGRVELLPRKPDFVGRLPEMEKMISGLLGKLATHSPVVVLYGLGGAGKTELATQVAHDLGEQFPRARIQVELGPPDEPVDEVAAEILLAFGLGERELPTTARARLRKLAELLEPGGCLLVLDNAATPDQLKGLLPATPRNAAIVTSRIRLAIDAAMLVRVGPLPEDDGIALLREIRGQLGETFDEDDARRVVELVDGLPLAIRLAAAMQPGQPLGAVVNRLADERVRLSHLDYAERLVGPVFDVSYRDLTEELARCFQVIGVVRSRSFTHELIAYAAGVEPVSAQLWLDQLVRRQLVEQVAADRFDLHELVWLHARQIASSDAVSPQLRTATQRRAVEWYANRISELMSAPGAHERPPDEALAWFAFERANLRTVVAMAREISAWEPLLRIAASCYGLYFYPGRWEELAEVAELGVEAARELGDPDAEIGRLIHLTEALRYTGRSERVRALYERAVALAREQGGAERLGWVLTHYGDFLCDLGRGEEAVHGPYMEAMALQRDVGGKCWVSAHIVDAYRGVRRFDKAIEEGLRSLELCTTDGSEATEAEAIWCRWHLAVALYEDGQLDEAEGHLLIAVNFHRQADDPGGLSSMLLILGRVFLTRGSGDDRVRAGEVLREARDLAHRIGASAREGEIDVELARLGGRQRDVGDTVS